MGTRMDAWNLSATEDWPQALLDYERAVRALIDRDPGPGAPTDRTGWRFLAAMHGIARPNGTPDTGDPLWNNCQHGSWFFFPWHRMYLHAFERIIQDVLEDPEWALPYWYSIDPDDPTKGALPPAFRDARPDNALFTGERSTLMNDGAQLPDLTATLLQALESDLFSTPDGLATFGGGERATPLFQATELGLLEGTPHGAVHVLVGNDFDDDGNLIDRGWMGSPLFAALDPIFWLHHANIDRLWQVWLDLSPDHTNPVDDPAWLETEFSFPDIDGTLFSMKVGDVLDTAALGYDYESTAAPTGVVVAPPVVVGGPDIGLAEADMPEALPPRMIGASDGEVPITASADEVEIPLEEPTGLGLGAEDAGGARVYLRLENVTGTTITAPAYAVYVNVPVGEPPEDHPELQAGVISTFGVAEASRTDELHDGEGLTSVFEITTLRDELVARGDWDASRLRISFVPIKVGPGGPVPEGDLRARRVAVYTA